MVKDIKEMNIYERMSEIEHELGPIVKAMTIGNGKNSYKAVGEADVLNAVAPLEYKYRIKSLPIKREVTHQETWEDRLDGYTKRMVIVRLLTTYRFVNLDNPSDFVDIQSLGDGADPMDKSSGKAQTYSDKFSLLKAYKAITGEDTDNTHSEDYEQQQQKAYANSLERVKKNLPDKCKAETAGNEKLAREAIKLTLEELGYENWKALDLSRTSEQAFMAIFNAKVNELEAQK